MSAVGRNYISQKLTAKKTEEKKKNFRRIFLGISLSMLAVLLIGNSVIYSTVKNLITRQNTQRSMEVFAQVQEKFETVNDSARMLAVQVMLDDDCEQMLNAAVENQGYREAYPNAVNQISLYQNMNPMVDSIYIYNHNLNRIISSRTEIRNYEFSDDIILEMLSGTEDYDTQNLILRDRTIRYANGTEKTEQVYSYIMYASRLGASKSAIVINIRLDSVLDQVLNMDIMKDSRMLIIDSDKVRLVDVQTCSIEETEQLREKVLQMGKDGQTHDEITCNGQKYFLSCLHSGSTGWYYVKVSFWNTIFDSLVELQKNVFAIMGALLLAVVAVAFGNSLSIAGIHKSYEKKYKLPHRQSELNRLQEVFLNNFFHGRRLFSKEQLRTEAEKMGFRTGTDARYAVLILQIQNYEDFRKLYARDGYNIKFGFSNIFEETFSADFRTAGLINRDATFTFMLQELREDGVWQDKIDACFVQFCENVKIFVPWKFFCISTSEMLPLEKIPEANERLKEKAREGFFYPDNFYCTDERAEKEHSGHANMQLMKTDLLTKAMRCGQEVQGIYEELTEKLEHCSKTEYMNAMIWMGITMIQCAEETGLYEGDANAFLVNLVRCEKAKDVNDLFCQLFSEIRSRQETGAEKKGIVGQLDEVKKYIEENYSNPNISLDSLGEAFGVSPNYLGRLFKKETGVSVAEYINSERLKCVLRELQIPGRTAKEIAEQCGFFNTNYFYTYFRKKVGMSPQEYRNSQLQIKLQQNEEQR